MKTNKPKVYREKPCEVCGNMFTPRSGHSSVCDSCKKIASERIQPEANKQLHDFLHNMNLYNRQHGTDYSYGQYVEMCHQRRKTVERLPKNQK